MKAFECKMCGTCCYGKGGITVNDDEIERVSDFLNITPEAFRTRYCRDRNGQLHLKTGKDGFCIFYHQEKRCTIHPVKPSICFLWPFYPANINDEYTWQLAKDACPGINPDSTFEEFILQAEESGSSKG